MLTRPLHADAALLTVAAAGRSPCSRYRAHPFLLPSLPSAGLQQDAATSSVLRHPAVAPCPLLPHASSAAAHPFLLPLLPSAGLQQDAAASSVLRHPAAAPCPLLPHASSAAAHPSTASVLRSPACSHRHRPPRLRLLSGSPVSTAPRCLGAAAATAGRSSSQRVAAHPGCLSFRMPPPGLYPRVHSCASSIRPLTGTWICIDCVFHRQPPLATWIASPFQADC